MIQIHAQKDKMKAKDYLENIRKLDNIINTLIAECENMKAMATKITVTYGGDKVKASGSQDKMADTVVKIMEYQEKINKHIDRYVDMRDNIMQVIKLIDNPDYIQVLYKRYYEFKTWELIAHEMGYTHRWVTKLHGRALNCMDNILNEE